MNDKILTRLFAVLSAQYGSKFTQLLQNDDAKNAMRQVWGNALSGIDPVNIKIALGKLPIEYPNWPPTVGQFLAITKIGDDPTMKPQLPKPRGDEKVALAALAELRRITGD